MAYVLGKTSRAHLQGVHPDLVRVVERAIQISKIDFSVLEGLRTPARQAQLVKTGASQTHNSKHIKQADGYGHAVDIVPWLDTDGDGKKEISWHWPHYYPLAEAMRQAAQELGVRIRWGGNWGVYLDQTTDSPEKLVSDYVHKLRRVGRKAFIDGPHYELVK